MARKYQLHGAFPSKAGDSAYEVAKQNGFEGTEKEWLASLVGKPGVDAPRESILYTPQELTEEQQAQARQNLGLDGLPTGGDPVLLVDFTAENDITGITIDSDDTETKYKAFFFELMTLSSPTNKDGEASVDCAIRLKINEAACWLASMSSRKEFVGRAYGYMVITDFSSCGFAWRSAQAYDIINTTNQYIVTTIYGASQKNFTGCYLGTQNGTNIMKAGTTLKVWGVKA